MRWVTRGTILHYDGSSWSAMSSGTTDASLGVWGSSGSNVFAVGWRRDDPALRRQQLVGDEQRHDQLLYGLWGSSGSNVFAVGDAGTILHYDGSSWSAMSSGTADGLMGVWGSSGSNVFAVGSGGTIRHYDGSSWSAMSSGTTNALRRVGQQRERRLRGG